MKLKINFNKFFNKVPIEEQINFAKNLAVLLRGGVTLNEAINSLADQARPGPMKKILYRLKGRIENGVSLNSAIAEEEGSFGKIFISLVKAGELSGSLADNLEFLSVWLERDSHLRKEINGVMLYPKIVLTAVILLGGGLTIFILPRLIPMFTSLHVELPLITKVVLSISLFIQQYWLFVIAGAFLIWLFIFLLFRIRYMKYLYHKTLVFLPYIKEFVVGYQLALFAQLMGTLLKSGITIDEALEIAYVGTSNLYYKKVLREIIDRIKNGISLVATMENYSELYPTNSMSVLLVGENSGTLEDSFFKISDFWTKEIIDRTKILPTIIEPVLLVVIALAVGLIAMSIILPIYKLTGNLGI
ncbi:MAG: type II secretion system F family protein [Candidatus Paceibacterota bacterium]